MITTQQSREYNRCKKLDDFLTENAAVYAGFAPFVAEVQTFDNAFQQLDKLTPNKTTVSTGITQNKSTLKRQVATALALVCRKTMAYANSNNLAQLAAETNTREDIIFKMKDAAVLPFAQHIQNLLQPLLTSEDYIPYAITAATLDDIVANAAAFNQLIGKANVTQTNNTTANTAINAQIKILQGSIAQLNLLIDEFSATDPAFVEGFHINTAVDKVGVRHSGIEGTVRTKAGEPLANALVQLNATGKTATTDINGFYHLARIMPGDYEVQVSAEGYTIQTKIQHITRGHIDEVNWDL